ncbi:MAG: hypothetical protein EOP11_08080 [Proteobacteria bacterium]|nr:MAG: hypothetical protein EOP11_08080 [Pseudomonadota bacterium]
MIIILMAGPAHGQSAASPNRQAEAARDRIYTELKGVSREMDNLPPCEGHRRFAEATGRHFPPRSCPLAREFFAAVDLAQNELVRNCEAYERGIDSALRAPGYCQDPERRDAAEDILQDFRKATEDTFAASHRIEPSDPFNNYDDTKGKMLTGEYLRAECVTGLEIAMEIRARQSNFLSHHYSKADHALSESCTDTERTASLEDFLRVLEDAEP